MRFALRIVRTLAVAVLALVFVSSSYATNPGSSANKLIIGDSIFALSGDIEEDLESALGESINSAARSGCQMIGGNAICSSRFAVPNQYANANKTGIRTVIMNGGGNDFLIGNRCPELTVEACREDVLAIEETISNLVSRMHSDGITKVVFLGYYFAPGAAELKPINDFNMDLKAATYPSQGIIFVDSRASFAGRESQLLISDGIHPNAAGSQVLANLILPNL